MQSTEAIFSKWIIICCPDYVIGSDKELYRLPFATWPNNYDLRRIKKQPGNRWKINGEWLSQRQLKKAKRVKINPNPEVLIKSKSDLPF